MKIIKSECLHQRKAHIFLTPEIILVAFRNTNQGHIKTMVKGRKRLLPFKSVSTQRGGSQGENHSPQTNAV